MSAVVCCKLCIDWVGRMAGLRGVCMLLEKHRDVICEDLNVDEVVPELVNKGILGVDEEKALVNEDVERAKAELLVSQLSKKGFAAFQEFCHVLEKSHPHLLTCFLMDVAGESCGVIFHAASVFFDPDLFSSVIDSFM